MKIRNIKVQFQINVGTWNERQINCVDRCLFELGVYSRKYDK